MARPAVSVAKAALAVLSFACLLALAVGADSKVVELNKSNFDEVIGLTDNVFVKFYTPWCGHCKRLAPDWEKVALLYRTTPDIVIAKLDCEAEKEICQKFGVAGYPTLKFFPAQATTPRDFAEQRTLENIVAFLNKKLGSKIVLPTVQSDVLALTIKTFDEVVLDREKNVLVEFYAPWCAHCKSLAPTYEKLAQIFKPEKDIVIAKVDGEAEKFLAQRYKVSGFPTVWWFPKDNKDGEEYQVGRELNDFVGYINAKAGKFRSDTGGYSSQSPWIRLQHGWACAGSGRVGAAVDECRGRGGKKMRAAIESNQNPPPFPVSLTLFPSLQAGRVPALDELAQQFMNAEGEEARKAVLAQAEAAVAAVDPANELQTKGAAHYVKTMKAVLDPEKGDAYIEKEVARVGKHLAGELKLATRETMSLRHNILSAFLPPPPPPAAAAEESKPEGAADAAPEAEPGTATA
ncbi:unnamed protein product [Closterium sp. Yama58-4]|nr:unnamed protein product [Closterium sp. Yama58-4]